MSPKKTYRLMALMAIAVIALLGVAIYSLSQINAPPSTPTLAIPTITATLRQDLPHFEYSDQGKRISPETFNGHWTLLSFWAHWCGPCLEEMPALDLLSQQWQGPNFEVLTVNVDDPTTDEFQAAQTYLSEQDLTLATVFDRQGLMKKAFAVGDLPQHFLISPEAKIVWQARGAFLWNDTKTRDQLMRIMGTDPATIAPVPDSAAESTAEPAK